VTEPAPVSSIVIKPRYISPSPVERKAGIKIEVSRKTLKLPLSRDYTDEMSLL
jgi:hypothetical protein